MYFWSRFQLQPNLCIAVCRLLTLKTSPATDQTRLTGPVANLNILGEAAKQPGEITGSPRSWRTKRKAQTLKFTPSLACHRRQKHPRETSGKHANFTLESPATKNKASLVFLFMYLLTWPLLHPVSKQQIRQPKHRSHEHWLHWTLCKFYA